MAGFGFSAECVTRPPRNLSGIVLQFFFFAANNCRRLWSPHCCCFQFTLRTKPLGEWSARRRDLYLTTRNAHQWQTFMRPAGFEPPIASKRAATHPRLRWRGRWDRVLSVYTSFTPTWVRRADMTPLDEAWIRRQKTSYELATNSNNAEETSQH